MAREDIHPTRAPAAPGPWDKKDELRRLDLLASVVAPTSLAGIAVAGAFLVSGKLVPLADVWLIVLGIALIVCMVAALITLAFNPMKVIERNGGDLDQAIEQKRKMIERALILMVAFLVLCSILALGSQLLQSRL